MKPKRKLTMKVLMKIKKDMKKRRSDGIKKLPDGTLVFVAP